MAPLTLHAISGSPPCRVASLVLDALKLEHEYKRVDLMAGEHKTPEYLKLNPQHTVPTLQDGDFVLSESRAIAVYLAETYDEKRTLLPADPKAAARVHQRLYFDAGVLADRFLALFRANVFFGKKEKPTEQETASLREAMAFLEDFLKPTGFAAGTDAMSLADLSLLATYSSIEATKGVYVNLDDYPESKKWAAKMKSLLPNYPKACGEGAGHFGGMLFSRTGWEA